MRVIARRVVAWSVWLVLCPAGAMAQGDPGALAYNRSLSAGDLADEPNPDPTPGRPRLLTGLVGYDTDLAETRDLSCEITVWINGEYVGGGGSGTGTCGDPGCTQHVIIGAGLPISSNPPLWDCSLFCVNCRGFDVNICTPPNVNPGPYCFCDQFCTPFRVSGGFGVPIGVLGPGDVIEIVLSVWDTGMPEVDTSDDQLSLVAADLFRCDADLNHDRVIDNGDIGAFITLFLQQSPVSDFNADGVVDNGDIGEFIGAFLGGC